MHDQPASIPQIRVRMAKPGDSPAAAMLLKRACPPLGSMGEEFNAVLAELISRNLVKCGLIEEFDARSGWVLSATGASAFVSDDLFAELLASKEPYGTAEIFRRAAAGGRGVLLDPGGVGQGNAGSGLNLFVLGFAHRYDVEVPSLRPLLARAIEHFVETHRGYLIRRILREDDDPIAAVLIASGMRPVRQYPADVIGAPFGRTLTVRERDDLDAPLFPDNVTARLFAYSQPVIRFTSGERRLLEQALLGLSDEDIAVELSLSVNTVKRVWKVIYDRARSRLPAALGLSDESLSAENGVRGAEKRRHLLAYLRDHPQELRPFGAG